MHLTQQLQAHITFSKFHEIKRKNCRSHRVEHNHAKEKSKWWIKHGENQNKSQAIKTLFKISATSIIKYPSKQASLTS